MRDERARIEGLEALLARVRAAAGPDRGIDGALMAAFDPPSARGYDEPFSHFVRFNGDGFGLFKPHAATPASLGVSVDAYTASLDAALALVERVLPRWEWQVGLYMGEYGQAIVRAPDAADDDYRIEFAQTPPLALITTLLTALLHQTEQAHAAR